MYQDYRALANLLESDHELRTVRFDRTRASEFVAAEVADKDIVGSESIESVIDEIGHRYFIEVENRKLPRDCINKLLDAAARRSDPDELRSLALGILLGTTAAEIDEVPNLLVLLLFRLSAIDYIDSAETTFEKISESLGDWDALHGALFNEDHCSRFSSSSRLFPRVPLSRM